jgi:nucleoid-associated protein EbfC
VFPGGGADMQQLLQQAQQMQQDFAAAQQELADTRVEGTAGGGVVKATVTGSGELTALEIDPAAVDPSDPETLAALVVAAVRDANNAARELRQGTLGPLAQGLGGVPGLPF